MAKARIAVVLMIALVSAAIIAVPALTSTWNDSYCITVEHPAASEREGTTISSRLSLVPPGTTCTYIPPHRAPIEVTHSSLDRTYVQVLLALLTIVGVAAVLADTISQRRAEPRCSGPSE